MRWRQIVALDSVDVAFSSSSHPLNACEIDHEMRKRQSKGQWTIICCNIMRTAQQLQRASQPRRRPAPFTIRSRRVPGGLRGLLVRSGGHGAAASAIITGRWLIINKHLMRTTLKGGSVEVDLGIPTPKTHISIESLGKDKSIHQIL